MKLDFKVLSPYIISVLAIIVVNIMFFLPQFEGKVVRQGDIVQHVGMSKEAIDYKKSTGEQALWTNSMFSGMPTYQIALSNESNLLSFGERVLGLGFSRPAGYFIAGMIGMFLLFNLLGVNVWLSLLGAFLFGYTTNNLVLFEAGHNTKVMAVMTAPLVIAGVIMAYRKNWLLGAAVFGIGFGINVLTNHPQMTYYIGIAMIIYVIFEAVRQIREGKVAQFAMTSAALLVVAALAVGASAGKLWPTYEYTKSTMRGGQVLAAAENKSPDAPKTNADAKGGLQWDYAMQWSNGVGDLLATFIPKAVGGGSGEWLDKDSEFVKATGQRQDMQIPTYWGSLPFTSGPAYYGIVAFFLFVFGLFVVKGELKWWLLITVLLTTLMSMGQHFEGFNRFLFDNLPMLNKFRAPSSILSVTAIFIPILGILGLSEIAKTEDKSAFVKPLFIATGIVGGICAILWLMGGSFFDFTSQGDGNYEQNIKDLLSNERQSMLASSSMRSLLFVLAIAGVLYFYMKNKLNMMVATIAISLLTLVDVFPIGKDYLDKRDFVNKNAVKKDYEMRDVDTQILADKDLHYRVHDVTVDVFNSALPAYHHKLIGGYHPAKLQRYQDMIERYIAKGDMGVLGMLNARYIINKPSQEAPAIVQRNPFAKGNAWFADNVIMAKSPNEEIDSVASVGVTKKAIIHQEFKDYIASAKIEPSRDTIFLTKYSPNKLEYKSTTSAERLALFSEVWYGPNMGWQASIDGKPVDHIRANYVLRSLKIPSGEHTVTFEFKPTSYQSGNTIGYVCSSLLLLLLAFAIWRSTKAQTKEA